MTKIYENSDQTQMSMLEHLQELRERIFYSLFVFIIMSIICLAYTKQIAITLQKPALGIRFLQLAPGEYLFVSIKIAVYLGATISSPFTIYQIMLFVIPGLTKKEKNYFVPTLAASILLFFIGMIFSYKILIPAALTFLINYGSSIVEPMWSFEEYFNFILLILLSTGITFQIPIIQILLGISKIISSKDMLKYWKYIAFISSIIGAIITPSTDPITQILMTSAILLLYLVGITILKFLDK